MISTSRPFAINADKMKDHQAKGQKFYEFYARGNMAHA
jgi:hypothetical protein